MSKRNKLPTWAMWIIFILCGSLLFAAVANVDNIKDKIDEWREDDTEESETNKKDDTDPSDTSGTSEPVKYTLSGVWKFNNSISSFDFPDQDVNFVSNSISFVEMKFENGYLVYVVGDVMSESAAEVDAETTLLSFLDDSFSVVDFGTEPQEVSEEFYEWFTSNAKIRTVYTVSGVWKFGEDVTADPEGVSQYVNFISSDTEYALIYCDYEEKEGCHIVNYTDELGKEGGDYYCNGWEGYEYRTIDFGTEPQEVSEKFYIWFTANAVKQ